MPSADGSSAPRASGADTPRPAPRSRPSPRPARLMVGAAAIAALTVIGAGLVRFPLAADEPVAAAPESGKATAARSKSEQPVRYVRLKPGQKAPKGAKVIREAAPTPRVVIRRATPATQPVAQAAPRRVVTRTRQSG